MKKKKDYVMINGKKEYFTPLELIDPYPTLSKRDVVEDFFLVEEGGEPYMTIDETKLFINSIYKDIKPANGYFINENGKPYVIRENVRLLGNFVKAKTCVEDNDIKIEEISGETYVNGVKAETIIIKGCIDPDYFFGKKKYQEKSSEKVKKYLIRSIISSLTNRNDDKS